MGEIGRIRHSDGDSDEREEGGGSLIPTGGKKKGRKETFSAKLHGTKIFFLFFFFYLTEGRKEGSCISTYLSSRP